MKPVVKVLVTGAAGQIGYAITPMIARGEALGHDQPIHLVLLDIPQAIEPLRGTKMELEDGTFPMLTKIDVTSNAEEAFAGVNYAFLLAGALALKPNMPRSELLAPNKKIYTEQARHLDNLADKDVRVLVIANPANTIARILIDGCKRVQPKQISCLTRLDHNRTIAQTAMMIGALNRDIRKVIVWGNHSSTMQTDISYAEFKQPDGSYKKVMDVIKDPSSLETLAKVVQERANEVTKARQKSSALSAAKASVDHMRSWIVGTPEGDFVSMGVLSDGNHYGIPEGIVFGVPVTCKDGEYTVVSGLKVDEKIHSKMMISAQELLDEWKTAQQC